MKRTAPAKRGTRTRCAGVVMAMVQTTPAGGGSLRRTLGLVAAALAIGLTIAVVKRFIT